MMKRLHAFVCGNVVFAFKKARMASVFDFLLQEKITTIFEDTSGDEGMICVLLRDAAKLSECSDCRLIRVRGLRTLAGALVSHRGVVAGAVVGLLLLTLSTMTVWRVDVRGNKTLLDEEIIVALQEAGLSVGDFIPTADFSAVKTRVLKMHPEIGWLSISSHGTTISVEIRESVAVENLPEVTELCNLVAYEDGIIESVNATAGRAVVRRGMSVRAGELLISGIYRTATGLRAVRAEGEVRARVVREVTVTEPMCTLEKRAGEAICVGLTLNFFGKTVKLFEKTSNLSNKYDIINKNTQWRLPGGAALPMFAVATFYTPYVEQILPRDESATVSAAYQRLREEITRETAGAVILQEEYQEAWTEDGFCVTCRLECVVDIANPSAYGVEE